MVTLHEVITFLVSMQISISSLQTHNVNRCGRSRHLARKLSLRRKRSSPNRSEERFSRNAETDLVCRLLLEKKNVSPGAASVDAKNTFGRAGNATGDARSATDVHGIVRPNFTTDTDFTVPA